MNAVSEPNRHPAFAAIARLLAEPDQHAELLDCLQQEALEAIGGTACVLIRVNPRTGMLQPVPSRPATVSGDPWPPGCADALRADEVLSNRQPEVLGPLAASMPRLAALLGSSSALAVPLLRGNEPLGLVAVGLDEVGDPGLVLAKADWMGDAFVLALDLARLRREADFQRELRALLDAFSRVASSSLNLGVALDAFCRDAAALFGAEHASVWLHDREARDLVLAASSDPAHAGRGTRVPTDSTLSLSAVAMRRPKAEFQGPGVTLATTITIPLKGRRRALGTIVLDDLRIEAGSDLDVLDAADELGRQVSGAIENVQLLEEVLRSRRATRNEPFATGTETTDLIAVCDARLRLVDVNHALAERLGITRKQAAGRYLVDCIGLQAASWIRALDLWGTSASSDTFSRELDDAILNGRFSFTISALLGTEGDPQGAVLVARQVP